MAHIPGLNYAQTKTKSKASKADGRQCQVVSVDHSRCLVTFTLKGSTQRAVLPLDRLYSDQGPCGHERPPVVSEKLLCDMTPVTNTAVNAQWLVAFAWRGKLDSAPKSGPLTAVTGMVAEVGPDSGVLLFVTPAGCRERCAVGRAAVQPDDAPLPATEPLSNHLQVGEAVLFDCRPTTAAANCRWLADKVWFSSTLDDSFFDEDDVPLPVGEHGEFILRVTLKGIEGRVDLVRNFKAVLTFEHGGQRHRALLLTAKYTFPEKATAIERRDLTKVLSRGDHVRFTCHEYDKPDGTDHCGWWVMEAVKLETERAVGREAGYFQSGLLYEKIGTVKDVLPEEGLLHFVLEGRREVAWFSSQEVFINGRPCNGRLSDALETGQRVHFNAEPSRAPRGADWRCTCVWRGEMPTVEASKKRSEAAAVKKQKKSKPGKSRIDDLDDFELPAPLPSGAGDGWAVSAATVHVPQSSPHHAARLGGGDRGGTAKQAPRLRASMVDALDDFDTGFSGSGGLSGDGGADWTMGSGGWDGPLEETGLPAAADEPGQDALLESTSSGPSRPLSDASLEHALGPPGLQLQSPSRTAVARQSPAGRGSPADPSRPPLLPLLEHSVPMPDPSLPRPPLLPAPNQRAWPAGLSYAGQPPAASSQARAPPGLSTPRQAAGPTDPPGMSPAALAAAAAANYSQQQQQQQQQAAAAAGGSAGLLGDPPPSQRVGLLPAPQLPSFYGYPTAHGQPYWMHPMAQQAANHQMAQQAANHQMAQQAANHQMAQQAAARESQMAAHLQQQQLLYGVGLVRPGPVMPPLTVDQESLEQMVRGGRMPISVSEPASTTSSQRRVPTADWEAAAAAFQAAAAPDPASPTLESVERRPTPTAAAAAPEPAPTQPDLLSARLAAAALDDGTQQTAATTENGLDEMLDELEADAVPFTGADDQPPLLDVEPVSGRGQILAFVDESRGLAEWERDGRIEQVMFDRDICYWLDARMDTLDLTDCYTPGAQVLFECVPAEPQEPYQWVATHFQQVED